jgi:hypothetical protein
MIRRTIALVFALALAFVLPLAIIYVVQAALIAAIPIIDSWFGK